MEAHKPAAAISHALELRDPARGHVVRRLAALVGGHHAFEVVENVVKVVAPLGEHLPVVDEARSELYYAQVVVCEAHLLLRFLGPARLAISSQR